MDGTRPATGDRPAPRHWRIGLLAAVTLAVALVSAGSAWYHASPDNARLAWDRPPVAAGFMALFAALVAGRVSAAWGARLLLPLVVAVFPARCTRSGDLLTAVLLYGASKAAEALDRQVRAVGGFVSGHTLEHLLAAAARRPGVIPPRAGEGG